MPAVLFQLLQELLFEVLKSLWVWKMLVKMLKNTLFPIMLTRHHLYRLENK